MRTAIVRLRQQRLLGVVVFGLALVAGCAGLPDSGPIHTTPAARPSPEARGFDYHPRGPAPGDEPIEIVEGFLDALRETPLTFSVAREFLTDAASAKWTPSHRTIIYADGTLLTRQARQADTVTVNLGSMLQLDRRGGWQGDPTDGRGERFRLQLTQVEGQWRITNPPNALIVSRNHFDSRFLRYNLYFFDPSGRVLVPEPVYLPSGQSTPTLLVDGLLQGPDPSLQTVERTFFPPGTRLDISAPVDGGVVEVPLSEEMLDIDGTRLDQALAQLAWTLRQVPDVDRMRVTVEGTPLDQETGASARSVDGWSGYDPSLPTAPQPMFAMQEDAVVAVDPADGDVEQVGDLFAGAELRSLAVGLAPDPADLRMAAVASNGRDLLVAELSREPAEEEPTSRVLYRGTDLARPSYDLAGQLWLADRRAEGTAIRVLRGTRWRTLQVPGISGRSVEVIRVSRDGTRLAALVEGEVLVARISRNQNGRPTGVGPALQVGIGQLDATPLDIAYTASAMLGVLVTPGERSARVDEVSVDGSLPLGRSAAGEALFAPAQRLLTWPGAEAPTYVQISAGGFFRLSSTGHWMLSPLSSDLQIPTFAG